MILLENLEISFDMIKNAALVLVALFGFQKIMSEIIARIGKYTKKEEKLENFDPEKIKQDLMGQYFEDQQKKWHAYDVKIAELEGKIDNIRTDFLAKNQEMKAELYLQTYCMEAVLDGLHQLNCNGPVTEAKEKLHNHIKYRAFQ